jgi:transcription-repair coupling factor (superfamily II helicase)
MLLFQGQEQTISSAEGFHGSSYSVYLAEHYQKSPANFYIVFKDEDKARAVVTDLRHLLKPENVLFFPPYDRLDEELLPPNALTVHERMRCLKALLESDDNVILVTTHEAIRQRTLPKSRALEMRKIFQVGKELERDALLYGFVEMGYRREEMVASRGEFSVRGDIIDVFPSTEDMPFRLEFFGDELESIRTFELYSQKSFDSFKKLSVYPVTEFDSTRYELIKEVPDSVLEFLKTQSEEKALEDMINQELSSLVWLNPYVKSSGRIREYREKWLEPDKNSHISSPVDGIGGFARNLELFLEAISDYHRQQYLILLCIPKQGFLKRLQLVLKESGIPAKSVSAFSKIKETTSGVYLVESPLQSGFVIHERKIVCLTYQDYTGAAYRPPKKKKKGPVFEGDVIHHFSELNMGDFVVHEGHGIAVFSGIENILIDGVRKEYLVLNFSGSDKVFVPITEVDRISRYSCLDGKSPRLNKLDSVRWSQVKSKVKDDLQEFAKKLLEHYAKRSVAGGFSYSSDSDAMKSMEDGFEYEETHDQLRAISEIKKDMENRDPMERLLCGDVGFGKTEVAIRAAYKAVQDGKQVAVLCPTTILSQQHFQTFHSRLLGTGTRVEVLNRFVSTKQGRDILKRLKENKVDILIGTHRLFSKDVDFSDLGLLIIDEEQRFGVRHKEKLRELRRGVDTLALSATPIPRTLHMALGGARSISVIHTPPQGRLPVKTFVLPYQGQTVRQAIERELKRSGQVYYVYNRVDSIQTRAEQLLELVPGLRLRYLHGQMQAAQIEEVMTAFMRREFDVLLTTTIIESGMDIPNVNTIIVERADAFGLAQLYQLRGRIGRRESQGYAYLFYKNRDALTDIARKRLSALEEFTDLGSGFKIAMRDLEIRGAGNLLGKHQSGFIYNIGFDLYARLLRDAIEKLKDSDYKEEFDMPQIELQLNSYVNENYISSYRQRMDLFRRLSSLRNVDGLESLKEELLDRYGPFTREMHELFEVVQLRIYCHAFGVKSLKQMNQRVYLEFHEKISPWVENQLRSLFRRQIAFSDRFPNKCAMEFQRLNSREILEQLKKFFNSDKVEDYRSL